MLNMSCGTPPQFLDSVLDPRVTLGSGGSHRGRPVHRFHLHTKWDFILRFDNLREGHKLVDELLTHDLFDDVLIVVIPQGAAQLVIVHVGFVFAKPPHPGHFLCVIQLKFTLVPSPCDEMLVAFVHQEFEQKLPEGDTGLHTFQLSCCDRVRWLNCVL